MLTGARLRAKQVVRGKPAATALQVLRGFNRACPCGSFQASPISLPENDQKSDRSVGAPVSSVRQAAGVGKPCQETKCPKNARDRTLLSCAVKVRKGGRSQYNRLLGFAPFADIQRALLEPPLPTKGVCKRRSGRRIFPGAT